MDLISKNPGFKKRLLFFWSLALLLLHVIYTLLSAYDSYISGDIMHKAMDTVLAWIIPIVALLLIYLRYAVMISAYHSYDEGTLPFTAVGIISLLLTRISEHIIYTLTYTNTASTASYILSIVTSFMIDLGVVLLLLLFSRSKKERQRSIVPLILITCAFPLAISLFEEAWFLIKFLIELKAEYGTAALTAAELSSVILAFARPLINAVVGLVIMLFTHKILKAFSKN